MAIKFAINGFGRIGRLVLRAALRNPDLEAVVINDLTDAKTLAHLFKYDSVHGTFNGKVSAEGDALVVDGKMIRVTSQREPANLPWKELEVEVVAECTGFFTKRSAAAKHIEAGASKVVISAPSPDADFTILYGVNHDKYDSSKHQILSNASCTTNCLAPIAKVIMDSFGIESGLMTTIHSYTNDQRILDLPHSDPRRSRAAALSMIPTSTGAAKAISLVIPELAGKLHGMAIRVPTPNVSLVDLVCKVKKKADRDSINEALCEAASSGPLSSVLSVSEELLVSSDFNGCTASSTVDLASTMTIGDDMVKVLSWYDNETGFAHRMVDVMKYIL